MCLGRLGEWTVRREYWKLRGPDSICKLLTKLDRERASSRRAMNDRQRITDRTLANRIRRTIHDLEEARRYRCRRQHHRRRTAPVEVESVARTERQQDGGGFAERGAVAVGLLPAVDHGEQHAA